MCVTKLVLKRILPVELGAGRMRLLTSLANLVNLLVHLSAVVVSVLTSTGNSVGHPSRMPGTNTGNLAETPVGLARKTGDTPSSDNTFVTLTLGDTNDVNHLVLLENRINRDLLLKKLVAIVHLVSDSATVDLDLHKVGLLLLQALHLPDLNFTKTRYGEQNILVLRILNKRDPGNLT
uniref:Uncharacterized protein n=1 Tax=Oryza brachyantha TaxID=4533 RepID=J3NBP8_ORYBR